MSIDMYKNRTMLMALQQLFAPKNWLLKTFFKKVETHKTKYIDIDITNGDNDVAVYVDRTSEANTVEREGFDSNSHVSPYVYEKIPFTAENAEDREAGQNVYESTDTPAVRAQKSLGADLQRLRLRLLRLIELQCSQGLQYGYVDVEGKGVNYRVDFKMKATHKIVLSGTSAWNDTVNSLPLTNFRDWGTLISDDSGLVAGDALLGSAAWTNLLRNTDMKDLLSNRRIVMGEINTKVLAKMGVKYHGYLNDPGIDIWEYTDKYRDIASGNQLPYIESNRCVMIGAGADFRQHYGAINNLKTGGNFVGRAFPRSWVADDPQVRWGSLESAPLMAPHQVDGIVSAIVTDN